MLKLVAAIKYCHVLKRDKQKHLAYMYRARRYQTKEQRDHYRQWAKSCDVKAEAGVEVLAALEKLGTKLRGEFSRRAMR